MASPSGPLCDPGERLRWYAAIRARKFELRFREMTPKCDALKNIGLRMPHLLHLSPTQLTFRSCTSVDIFSSKTALTAVKVPSSFPPNITHRTLPKQYHGISDVYFSNLLEPTGSCPMFLVVLSPRYSGPRPDRRVGELPSWKEAQRRRSSGIRFSTISSSWSEFLVLNVDY